MTRQIFRLLLMLCFPVPGLAQAPADSLMNSVISWQHQLNNEYRDPESSPLPKDKISTFEGHAFFQYSPDFCVKTRLVRTPEENSFKMKTTTERLPLYRKYGELHFELQGQPRVLNVYQSLDLLKNQDYKDYLFLPFTDLSNGNGSYGGGRFIDLRIPTGEELILDFNKAYNPYCAYNKAYSCPVPPAENYLPLEVTAGIKAPAGH